MIPDEAVEAAALAAIASILPDCASKHHIPPVQAAVRGTYLKDAGLKQIWGVWSCETCATRAESYGLFTRDEGYNS